MAPSTMYLLATFLVMVLAAVQSASGMDTLEEEERAFNHPGNVRCPEYKCTQWSKWGSCPVTCGSGNRVRTRSCKAIIVNPKKPCSTQETHPCNMQPCPVDGNWGRWSQWSRCTVTCGGGYHYRFRKCDNPPPKYGGRKCVGPGMRRGRCNTHSCTTPTPSPSPVDCTKCPNTVNYVGYMADPKDCSLYYVCIFNPVNPKSWRAVQKSCPAGLLWSQEILTCVRPSFKPSPCGRASPCASGQKYSPSPKNCNTYYKCGQGTATRMCCPPGQGWIQQRLRCGHTRPPCRNTCVKVKLSGNCDFDQYFYMPCNDTGKIFPRDHSCQRAYIGNYGKVTRYRYGRFGSACRFSSFFKTKLEVPFFSNWFYGVRTISAVLWFKPSYYRRAGTSQYLLHNGDCKAGPSISMYLYRISSGALQLRTRVNGQLVGSVQVTMNQWVYAALVYNGDGYGATLYTWSRNKWQNRSNRYIKGPVKNRHCPLTFGSRLGKYIYNGLIDEARIFKRFLTYDQVKNLRSKNRVE